jgi:hypothetical protein
MKKIKIAGVTPMIKRTRQPSVGTTRSPIKAATTIPAGKAASMFPEALPRTFEGMYSVKRVLVTGCSPPRPIFAKNRVTASEATLQEADINPVNMAKIPTVAWKEVLRPI